MAVYAGDDPRFFTEAVHSILEQSSPPTEVLIAIDGPIGSAIESSITTFRANPLFRIIRLSENSGPGVARAEAIKVASTDLIAVMDADDISVDSRFELELKEFADESLDVVGGLIEEFRASPGDLRRIRMVPPLHEEILVKGRRRYPMNHVTLMFRRDAYLRAGGYGRQRTIEDYDLFFRMQRNGAVFRNIQKVLVLVRCGNAMATRRRGFEYLRAEVALYTRMYNHGYLSRTDWCVNLCTRMIARSLPSPVLDLVYRQLRRLSG